MPTEWEDNTERRLGIAEHKIDKLLDPVEGIYALLASIERRLAAWAIAILTAIIVSLIAMLIVFAATGKRTGARIDLPPHHESSRAAAVSATRRARNATERLKRQLNKRATPSHTTIERQKRRTRRSWT
jgi:hypothetical protein